MSIPDSARRQHLDWLVSLTQIPTAAGREGRVIRWIERWTAERDDLKIERDAGGNLTVAPATPWPSGAPPVYITAHLDHPAFVVERIVSPTTVEVGFRGGVMDVFFEDAPIVLVGREGERLGAQITECTGPDRPIAKAYLAELGTGDTASLHPGDVGVWDLPEASVDASNILHTNACDDLAGVAAALSAMDVLRSMRRAGETTEDVRLLLTRAEEIGFVGAIAACRHETAPAGSRLIALENSRSFADSPIGGGPILRVGDRVSTFTPTLTAAVAKRAEEATGSPALPTASQRQADLHGKRWQRKLMPGGACEASVYCAFGYESTCLCLPLGNYHNMAHLAALQAGEYDREELGPPRTAPEYISVDDFGGLVDVLVAVGQRLPAADPFIQRIDRLYTERAHILDEPTA